MKPCYIIDAVRTPIGKYGGKLCNTRPDDLLAFAIKALIKRNPNIQANTLEFSSVMYDDCPLERIKNKYKKNKIIA